jgi:hypothetical protein
MSFWAGIILKNQVVLLIDRLDVSVEERRFFKSTFIRRIYHKKYHQINSKTFLLPAGSLYTSGQIGKIICDRFTSKPISENALLAFQKEFREKSKTIWNEVKPIFSKSVQRIGVGVPNLDCLLAGINPSGRPYLANFNDVTDFYFFIKEDPGTWIISPMGPLEKEIGEKVCQFLGVAMELPDQEQALMARKVLWKLVPWIAMRNRFVSAGHDLIIVSRDGAKFYESRRLLPWEYKVTEKGGGFKEEEREGMSNGG